MVSAAAAAAAAVVGVVEVFVSVDVDADVDAAAVVVTCGRGVHVMVPCLPLEDGLCSCIHVPRFVRLNREVFGENDRNHVSNTSTASKSMTMLRLLVRVLTTMNAFCFVLKDALKWSPSCGVCMITPK